MTYPVWMAFLCCCRHGLLTEDCLAVFEVWCSRVCKGLEDTCPLSVMKSTDSYAVAQMEFPLAEGSEEAKGNAGKNHSVPAAGEGSAPANVGAATKTGEGCAHDTCAFVFEFFVCILRIRQL